MAAFIFFLQNSLPACLHDVDRHFSVCQRNNVKGWILAIKWFPLYGKCGNKCVHAQYIHTHIFLTYFQTKNRLFAVTTTEMYLQAGLTPKEAGTQSWQEPEHGWLLAESSSLCTMWHVHCKAQECPRWSAAQQLEFQPQILLNFDATTKECICNLGTSYPGILVS